MFTGLSGYAVINLTNGTVCLLTSSISSMCAYIVSIIIFDDKITGSKGIFMVTSVLAAISYALENQLLMNTKNNQEEKFMRQRCDTLQKVGHIFNIQKEDHKSDDFCNSDNSAYSGATGRRFSILNFNELGQFGSRSANISPFKPKKLNSENKKKLVSQLDRNDEDFHVLDDLLYEYVKKTQNFEMKKKMFLENIKELDLHIHEIHGKYVSANLKATTEEFFEYVLTNYKICDIDKNKNICKIIIPEKKDGYVIENTI